MDTLEHNQVHKNDYAPGLLEPSPIEEEYAPVIFAQDTVAHIISFDMLTGKVFALLNSVSSVSSFYKSFLNYTVDPAENCTILIKIYNLNHHNNIVVEVMLSQYLDCSAIEFLSSLKILI